MLDGYLKYVGLKKGRDKPESPERERYNPLEDETVAERYLGYLKEIDSYQKSRRATIENKNSQLVGQASVVTSIFSLFVPLLIGSFNGITKWVTIPFAILFLVVLFHYLLTILIAIKALKIDKYAYATRGTDTLTKANRPETEIAFLNEEISDLIFCINQSTPVDNRKGSNLILATRNFEIANVGFAILTVSVIVSTFFLKKATPEVLIKNPEEIQLTVPDTMNTYIKSIPYQDSITVKIDTNLNKRLLEERNDTTNQVKKRKSRTN